MIDGRETVVPGTVSQQQVSQSVTRTEVLGGHWGWGQSLPDNSDIHNCHLPTALWSQTILHLHLQLLIFKVVSGNNIYFVPDSEIYTV